MPPRLDPAFGGEKKVMKQTCLLQGAMRLSSTAEVEEEEVEEE